MKNVSYYSETFYSILSNMNHEFESPTKPINLHTANEVTDRFDATEEQLNDFEQSRIQDVAPTIGAIITELALREAGVSESPEEPPTEQLVDLAQKISERLRIDKIVHLDYKKTEAKISRDKILYEGRAIEMEATRHFLGMTQEKFADELGCSRFTVIRIEGGRQKVSSKYVACLNSVKAKFEVEDEVLEEHRVAVKLKNLGANLPQSIVADKTDGAGERMIYIRRKLGLNQTEFGELLGKSTGMISHYETNKSKVPSETVEELDILEAMLEPENEE